MSARCYTVNQVCELLGMCRDTFYRLLKRHQLPFLEELQPRIGGRARYRALLVDEYLANEWRPRPVKARRHLASHRKAS